MYIAVKLDRIVQSCMGYLVTHPTISIVTEWYPDYITLTQNEEKFEFCYEKALEGYIK